MFEVRSWLRFVLVLVVAVSLLIGALGCGAPEEEVDAPEEDAVVEEEAVEDSTDPADEEADAEEGEVSEAQDEDFDVDNWRNPTGVQEIVNNFSELEWSWARVVDGEEADSTVLSYRYEGSETVEGVDAEVLVFTLDGEAFKFWVDDDGRTVQAEVQGEIIPGQFVDTMAEGLLTGLFVPFRAVEEFGFYEALRETTPGVKWSAVSTETEKFGDLEAEVTRLEVVVGPPLTPEGEEGTAILGVGDFGDFQMLVEWDWAEVTGDGDLAVTYSLSKAVPR